MKMGDPKTSELLQIMLDKFDPASSLWRTIEISQVDEVLSDLNISGPTLDLGCGEGNIAGIVFNKNKTELIALDNWYELILKAKAAKVYRYVVLGDARMMPFKAGIFNTVFSNSVIEHIKEIDAALTGVVRILRPKGRFIFTVPSDKFGEYLFFYKLFKVVGLRKLANWYRDKRIDLLEHYNLLNKDGWARKLNTFGLKIVYAKGHISGNMLALWDFLAALGFALKKLRLPPFILQATRKIRRQFFYHLLIRFCLKQDLSENAAAAFLVVAQKVIAR